jgi:hypothetical protein
MPRQCARGTQFEKIDDGALSFAEAYELDAGPDDAIRFRSSISHFTCDSDVDAGTQLEVHRNATTVIELERVVLPQTEKFNRVGVKKLYPHTKLRNVHDRALPPLVRRLVFDMATAHPQGRFAFCPSAILHGPASQ